MLFPHNEATKEPMNTEDVEDATTDKHAEITTELPRERDTKEPETAEKAPKDRATETTGSGNRKDAATMNNNNTTQELTLDDRKEPECNQETPSMTGIEAKTSGSDERDVTQLPDPNTQNVAINTLKKPDITRQLERKYSNEESGEENNGELPEILEANKTKNATKKPKNAIHESLKDNDEISTQEGPDMGKLKEASGTTKAPKRKYKTEVEKLRELQNGLEVTTSRRSDTIATIQEEESNQCESTETIIEGDSPKTGLVE
jgi:hypothetical protein